MTRPSHFSRTQYLQANEAADAFLSELKGGTYVIPEGSTVNKGSSREYYPYALGALMVHLDLVMQWTHMYVTALEEHVAHLEAVDRIDAARSAGEL